MRIRPFDGEYRELAGLHAVGFPDRAATAETLAAQDRELREAGGFCARYFAEHDGELVGFSQLRSIIRYGASGRALLFGAVHPGFRRRGIGQALLGHGVATARARQDTELISVARVGCDGASFLDGRGWVEINRVPGLRLELTADKRAGWRTLRRRADEADVQIVPLSGLKASTPDWARRMYELEITLEASAPQSGLTFSPPTFEAFCASEFEAHGVDHDALFVAIEGGRWIGMTELRTCDGDETRLTQELTGVREERRGGGIASALKCAGFLWALERGFTNIRTQSNDANTPMQRLNAKLGFMPDTTWITFRLEL